MSRAGTCRSPRVTLRELGNDCDKGGSGERGSAMAALSYAGMIRIRFEGCISARGYARAPPGRRAPSMGPRVRPCKQGIPRPGFDGTDSMPGDSTTRDHRLRHLLQEQEREAGVLDQESVVAAERAVRLLLRQQL